MSSFSFIHIADLHLDSPFSALHQDNPDLARTLQSATFKAFENIVTLCIEKKIDFLLVAGDVYDGADRSLRAQIRFRDGLKRLDEAGIQSFIVHGNHDPLDKWAANLEWPSRVHIFRDKVETIAATRDNHFLASIQGISYPTRDEKRNLALLFKRSSPAFHIGLLHANVGMDTGHEPYAPCSLDDLLKPEMDYWALGHVHTKKQLSNDVPFVLYPGNTQGRNIRETGEKGCYLITVHDNREIETEFYAMDVIRWVEHDIPINDLLNEQDLINALDKNCKDINESQSGRPSIVRIRLTGNGPLYRFLKEPNTLSDLHETGNDMGSLYSPYIWIDRIRLHAGPRLDPSVLMERQDFLGELLRYSHELSEDLELDGLVKKELSALFENAKFRRYLSPPDKLKIKDLLKQAEKYCIQTLSNEEDA
jgi:DNA repair exonuclease SbcCD nuclease subunit